MSSPKTSLSLWAPEILRPAARDALRKLDPRVMVRNPVMFVVEVGSARVRVPRGFDPSLLVAVVAALGEGTR